MPDIPCIYKMSLVNEDDSLKEDFLKGKAFDVLLALLAGSKTIKDIANELDFPSFSIQLYIKRLLDARLIKVKDSKISDGKVEKTYELGSTDVEILNYLKENYMGSDNSKNVELSAQQFASMTREAIRNIGKYGEKPFKIKAYFIKADEEAMIEFKKDIEALFHKYQGLEDLNAEDTYGFISVFTPYKISNT